MDPVFSDIVFVRTRHLYDSYKDFWKLVELSDFETCFVDEMRLDRDAYYVVTPINGEFRPHIENELQRITEKKARVVWWCLERPDATGAPPFKSVIDDIEPFIDFAWACDGLVVEMDERLMQVVLGGHPGLLYAESPEVPRIYDWSHQSYEWGRRVLPYRQLLAWGLKEGPNAFDPERHETLIRTKAMVNIQQYSMPVIAPLRFAVAAAYRLPVVSESIARPFPHVIDTDILTADYTQVPHLVRELLKDEPRRRALGDALYETLCVKWTFRRGVEEGIKASI